MLCRVPSWETSRWLAVMQEPWATPESPVEGSMLPQVTAHHPAVQANQAVERPVPLPTSSRVINIWIEN